MNRSYQKSIDQSVWIEKVHNDHRIVDNNKVDSHLYMEKSHNYYHHSYTDTYTNTHTHTHTDRWFIRVNQNFYRKYGMEWQVK